MYLPPVSGGIAVLHSYGLVGGLASVRKKERKKMEYPLHGSAPNRTGDSASMKEYSAYELQMHSSATKPFPSG
jgi:hypothetical protein